MAQPETRNSQTTGCEGEQDVIDLVRCPNCGKKLMLLPPGYPLYDTQCTACTFRAQVKTNRCKPKNEIFGATWEILNKVLKAGFMIPPLIVNFTWGEGKSAKREIRFYPFIPRANIKKTVVQHNRPAKGSFVMFNYIGLGKLPHMTLFPPAQRGPSSRKANGPAKPNKMSGLKAAAKVLAEAGKPMHVREMVGAMKSKGYWSSDAPTPEATIYTAIFSDMRKNGEQSRFRKTGAATFGLAQWR